MYNNYIKDKYYNVSYKSTLEQLYPFAILSLCNTAPLFLENVVQTLLEDRMFGPPSPLAVAGR